MSAEAGVAGAPGRRDVLTAGLGLAAGVITLGPAFAQQGRARDDISEIAPDARVLEGLAVRGEDAAGAERPVRDWVNIVWTA